MSSVALLDTGVILAFYCGTPEPNLVHLMRTTLVETLSQLCKQPGGVTFAESTIASFLKNYSILVQDFDSSVAFKAGKLKCQHRRKLSSVDCVAIAYALNNNISFHTTEKELHEIIPKLKLETYSF
jgi:predicted nucleic acid-binding protein